MSLFNGLIYCAKCGKKHRAKKERGRQKYLCSTYNRYGKDKCIRNVVAEEEIIDLLELRYKSKIDKSLIDEKVVKIEVDEEKIEIKVSDGRNIVLTSSYGQF